MSSPAEGTLATPAPNLDHIYFFLQQPGAIDTSHTSDNNKVETTIASGSTRTRDSSPASTGSGSTATAAGSASAASTASSNLNPHAASFSPGSTSPKPQSQSSSQHSAPQLFEIQEIPGKGSGLVATGPISRGARIIREKPLLTIPENLVHFAWGSYCKLSRTEKEAFDQLCGYAPDTDGLENTARMCLISISDYDTMDDEAVDKLVDDQVRVMSIFSVNNFNLVPRGLAVYETSSRLNHSCVPNAYHGFNPEIQRFTVHAVRDIEPGEEITINYMGGQADTLIRTQRLDHLRTNYGFTCTCVACSDRTGQSDFRRGVLADIMWGIGQYEMGAAPSFPLIAADPAQAFQLANDSIGYLNAEGLQDMGLVKAFHLASKYALEMQDWHTAFRYALHEQEVELAVLGGEISDLKRIGAAASCWVAQVRLVIQEALGKKQAAQLFAKHGQNGESSERQEKRKGKPKSGKKKKKLPAWKAEELKNEEAGGQKQDGDVAETQQRGGKKETQGGKGKENEASDTKEPTHKDDVGDVGPLRELGKKPEPSSWAKIAAAASSGSKST